MADMSGKRVAILVYNYFEQVELTGPRDALQAAGATVDIISVGEQTVQGMEGDIDKTDTFDVDMLLGDTDLSQYDALVLPGGTVNADKLRAEDSATRAIKTFLESGKPTAVICHAPWTLISAGVADGKRLTSFPSLQEDLRNAGADWIDQEVVVDGNLITSRKPDDIPAFNDALMSMLEVNAAREEEVTAS